MTNSVRTSLCFRFMAVCFLMVLFSAPFSVFAEDIDYVEAYRDAILDAKERHKQYEDGRDYNAIGYCLCDLEGDGIKEFMVMQYTDRHNALNWIYETVNGKSFYMGEFDSDVYYTDCYGYQNGFLFKEARNGNVTLYHVRVAYDGVSKEELYSGSYDKDGEPPTLEDLSDYYNEDDICDEATICIVLDDLSILEEESSHSLQGTAEETENVEETAGNGVIDVANYLNTDINTFSEAVGDMKNVGASDGNEYSNDIMIAGAEYEDNEIVFFNVSGSGYSILGIECGMDYDEAIDSVSDQIESTVLSEGNINYFRLTNGNQLRVDYDDEHRVSNIDIWGQRTGLKEWPGWGTENTDSNDGTAKFDENELSNYFDLSATEMIDKFGLIFNGIADEEMYHYTTDGSYSNDVLEIRVEDRYRDEPGAWSSGIGTSDYTIFGLTVGSSLSEVDEFLSSIDYVRNERNFDGDSPTWFYYQTDDYSLTIRFKDNRVDYITYNQLKYKNTSRA